MNDVDLAMAGWEQLSKNPGKMQEVMESLKDPEVMAKAQEMLKDPVYMEAARKKVNELQAKAQQRGLIDRNGQPVAGAAAAAAQQMGVEGLAELGAAAAYPNVKAPGQGGGSPGMEAATRDPREWELENIERMKQGELNHAELGFANMKAAINDPGMMKNVMEMMKDPATMAEVRRARAQFGRAQSAARNSARNSPTPLRCRAQCRTARDLQYVIARGLDNRRKRHHQLNSDSSRSHAIFSVYLDAAEVGSDGDGGGEGGGAVRYGRISLCDLAGSENVRASGSQGVGLKEAGSINKSLFALGQVIKALAAEAAAGPA